MAKKMFNQLECRGEGRAAEVAKRLFCIQDRLASF